MNNVVIVGTGPAGLSAARGYREAGGDGRVTLIGEEEHPPYRRPPLTKEFLRGELQRSELMLKSPGWFSENSVELRLGCRVSRIDRRSRRVELESGEQVAADVCVLATGADPVRPPIPGADHRGVLLVRRLRDSELLARHAERGTSATVIGSGFIGCEAAASLSARGVSVTLVSTEVLPQAARLGDEAGQRLAGWLGELGVRLLLGQEVTAIHDGRHVQLDDGTTLSADFVTLAAGVAPRSELAEACALDLTRGAIEVDSRLAAADDFFRAAGDVAFAQNARAGRHLHVEHWGDALSQGEVAGRALAGDDARWEEVPGFFSTIGEHTLKYAAWGDGHEGVRFVDHGDGAFAIWYSRGQRTVGVLTHERDEDYERGRQLIAADAGA